MKKEFNTAVLFLVFNRLDTTKQVFEAIKKVKPKKFYIASDGPRKNRENEQKVVQEVREYILNNVDWDCELKTLFREKNLGCKIAVSSAITWFFEQEEQGIILEDDCLPSQSFFYYCEELLNKYKDDKRIWHIGGYKYNYQEGDEYSYSFSRFTYIWGWATWRDRWQQYDVDLNLLNQKLFEDYEFFGDDEVSKRRYETLTKLKNGEIDTWDYQWNFVVRINNGMAIRPKVNLIRNIGFGENATHTHKIKKDIVENYQKEISFPLNHPPFIMINQKDDKKHILTMIPFFSRLKRRICE